MKTDSSQSPSPVADSGGEPPSQTVDEDLAPLLATARRLKRTLPPVQPSPDFEEELRAELLTTARARRHAAMPLPPQLATALLLISACSLVAGAGEPLVIPDLAQTGQQKATA